MTTELYIVLVYVQTALSALIAGLAFWKFTFRSTVVKLVGLAFLVGFISNILAMVMNLVFRLNPNLPQSIYKIVYFCVIGLIYYHASGKRNKLVYNFFCVAFTAFAVVNLLFIQKMQINSYTSILSAIIIIIYSVNYFYRLMIDLPTINLQRLPMFWFNAAFLLFHSGALFLFVFTDYLVNVLNNNLLVYWGFHNILNIVAHLIVLVGLWIDLRNIKSPS